MSSQVCWLMSPASTRFSSTTNPSCTNAATSASLSSPALGSSRGASTGCSAADAAGSRVGARLGSVAMWRLSARSRRVGVGLLIARYVSNGLTEGGDQIYR